MSKGRILVTGATGFVGQAVIPALQAAGWQVRAAVRSVQAATVPPGVPPGVEIVSSPDLADGLACDWRAAVAGCQAVLHLAARVHQMNDSAADPLAAFRHANRDSVHALAEQAAAAGVTRLVFVSSIKVNGEETPPGRIYRPDDTPAPCDPYGVSKAEAEAALWAVAKQSGLQVVVVRPPLVYGPGVKANFAALMEAVWKGTWLPLGAVQNKRSLVSVGNLVSALVVVADHPAAAGQTFFVSDGEDLSTSALIRRLGQAMGRSPRLVAVPPGMLRAALRLIGKGAMADRLLGSLVVDSSALRDCCGWQPPLTVDQGLAAAVRGLKDRTPPNKDAE